MDYYRYRSKARLVAIVDLILSSMSLCICLILLLGAVLVSTSNNSPQSEDDSGNRTPGQDEAAKRMLVTFVWVLVVFCSVTTVIQILAAIKLLNASQLGKDPVGALKLCTFWRHVCVVFTCLLVFSVFMPRMDSSTSVFTVIQIGVRISAIYVVTKFMRELEAAVNTGVLPIHCPPGTTPIIAGVAYAYVPPMQCQASANPDLNAAPPSYQEVVKEKEPQMKE
ncbi:unnamed protein product [Orchesella dallaii]|uniref:Uncharacterized protein n=1 Tax=Orchesella dallaii TaxID=48710 RepID=A0ABP1RB47_9HEXA